MLEAMRYHLMPEQRATLTSNRTTQRKPEGAKAYLFAIGGGSLFAIHSECEVYNPRTDRWQSIEPMEVRRSRATLTSNRTAQRKPEGAKAYLFAIGGGSLFAIHSE